MSVDVFISFAQQDEKLLERLECHLAILKRKGLIRIWHRRQITAGEEQATAIDSYLETSSLILLLISASYFASERCWGFEMPRAMDRHNTGKARVIPVILRPTVWKDAPFGGLRVLPRNEKPVISWNEPESAFLEVTKELRRALSTMDGQVDPPKDIVSQSRIRYYESRSKLRRGQCRVVWILLTVLIFVFSTTLDNKFLEAPESTMPEVCFDEELLKAVRVIDAACDPLGSCDYSKLKELDDTIHKYYLFRSLLDPRLSTVHLFYPQNRSRVEDIFGWRSTKRYQMEGLGFYLKGMSEFIVFVLARADNEGDSNDPRLDWELSHDRVGNIINFFKTDLRLSEVNFRVAPLGGSILSIDRNDADVLEISSSDYRHEISALNRSAHIFAYPCRHLLH